MGNGLSVPPHAKTSGSLFSTRPVRLFVLRWFARIGWEDWPIGRHCPWIVSSSVVVHYPNLRVPFVGGYTVPLFVVPRGTGRCLGGFCRWVYSSACSRLRLNYWYAGCLEQYAGKHSTFSEENVGRLFRARAFYLVHTPGVVKLRLRLVSAAPCRSRNAGTTCSSGTNASASVAWKWALSSVFSSERYNVAKPVSCAFLHKDCAKWKKQNDSMESGNTSLNAFAACISKSVDTLAGPERRFSGRFSLMALNTAS